MKTKRILPPATIGIIGAGQLGYYMALEALNMGYKVMTFDPVESSPAHRVAKAWAYDFNDYEKLESFCKECDVITYEFENMNLDHIVAIDEQFNLPQGSKMLLNTAHRHAEIIMAQKLGIPCVKSVYLEDGLKHEEQVATLNYPIILKTCRFGYDGKGQEVLKEFNKSAIQGEILASEFIKFDREISIILARTPHEIQVFPAIENKHHGGILDVSKTLSKDVYDTAKNYAKLIAEAMDYVGVMAVEFFVCGDEVIFNEVAPRPHNSGHYTLEAANKSQFRVHIEALCHLELGELKNVEEAVMINLLGQDLLKARTLMGQFEGYHYEYGKDGIKHNRKMGHVIFKGDKAQDNARNYQRELKK